MSRANTARGEIEFELDGATIVLSPTLERVQRCEAALGDRTLFDIAQGIANNRPPRLGDVVTILDAFAVRPRPSAEDMGRKVLAQGIVSACPPILKLASVIGFGKVLGEAEGEESSGGETPGNEEPPANA